MHWRDAWLRWHRPIGVVLGLLALAFVAAQLLRYRAQLDPVLHRLDPALLAASLLLAVAAQTLFALGWVHLLKSTASRISRLGAFSSWSISLAAKYLPGKVWQAVMRKGTHGNQSEPVLPLYGREQLISVGVASLFVAMHAPRALPAESHAAFRGLALLAGLALVGAATTKWLPSAVPARLRHWWSHGTTRPRIVAQVCLLNGAGYALFAFGLATLMHGLSIPGPGVAELASALCFAGLAGVFVFFIPAGLGVREAGLYWFLAPVVGIGPAALIAVTSRAWLVATDLLMVALGTSISAINRSAAKR